MVSQGNPAVANLFYKLLRQYENYIDQRLSIITNTNYKSVIIIENLTKGVILRNKPQLSDTKLIKAYPLVPMKQKNIPKHPAQSP